MSINPNSQTKDSSLGNARWGTAVIVLVVAIITLVVFYVINNNHSPAPQPVNAAMPAPAQPAQPSTTGNNP